MLFGFPVLARDVPVVIVVFVCRFSLASSVCLYFKLFASTALAYATTAITAKNMRTPSAIAVVFTVFPVSVLSSISVVLSSLLIRTTESAMLSFGQCRNVASGTSFTFTGLGSSRFTKGNVIT